MRSGGFTHLAVSKPRYLSSSGDAGENAEVLNLTYSILSQKGHTSQYRHFVSNLTNLLGSSGEEENVRTALIAIKHSASLLGKNRSDIVRILCDFDWASASDETFVEYESTMVDILSAHSAHLPNFLDSVCLRMLLPLQRVPEALVTRLQHLIHRIHHIIPRSPTVLFPAILRTYPHKTKSVDVQLAFLQHVLGLCDTIPELRDRLLSVVVDKIIQLDVELRLDEVMDEEEDGEQDIFHFELDEVKRQHIITEAEKVDCMMQMVFIYLKGISNRSDDECDRCFLFLLRIFDSIILHTHKAKYTQFIIYYFSSVRQHYSRDFLGFLLHRLQEECSKRIAISVKCVAYIGSYVARSNFISEEVVYSVVAALIQWAKQYLLVHGGSSADAKAHALFYGVCQAIFYIVCFRRKELLSREDSRDRFRALQLANIIESSLNPFKICLSSVVTEFTRVVESSRVLECAHVLERNESVVLPSVSIYGGRNVMDMYFPFDPMLLERCTSFISPLYTEWSGVEEGMEHEDGAVMSGTHPHGHAHHEDEEECVEHTTTRGRSNSNLDALSKSFVNEYISSVEEEEMVMEQERRMEEFVGSLNEPFTPHIESFIMEEAMMEG